MGRRAGGCGCGLRPGCPIGACPRWIGGNTGAALGAVGFTALGGVAPPASGAGIPAGVNPHLLQKRAFAGSSLLHLGQRNVAIVFSHPTFCLVMSIIPLTTQPLYISHNIWLITLYIMKAYW